MHGSENASLSGAVTVLLILINIVLIELAYTGGEIIFEWIYVSISVLALFLLLRGEFKNNVNKKR